ncbi:MAG TPA: glycosyltransferase family 4 protein [Bacteroidia bacterium]|jgi:glycosyltransferase involved in cell wall biosynthesis
MKKKVLIFIDWYLPGYKAGGPIQSVANLVEHLKKEYDFLIVTRNTDYCESIPYPGIKSDEWTGQPNGTKIYYFSDSRLTRSNINSLIRETEFDFIYLNGIFSVYFTLIPLFCMRKRTDKAVVIAARGMFAGSALEVKKTKKKFFMNAARLLRLFKNVVFHATNETEERDIKKALGEMIPVRIAGNLPGKALPEKYSGREKLQGHVRLVNIARIAPEKNLLYALEVLKQVKYRVDFDFYGPVYNQEYWAQCKLVLDELPGNVRACYKGSIESHKVMSLLQNYHVMFMPTAGENFGHIILQALSAGCPVLISDQTPWNDLKNKGIGYDLQLSDQTGFADVIDEVAGMSQSDYDKTSKRAFDYALQYASNPAIIEQNRHLFR